ncbi:hypothetical protein NDU88_008747 [Pleurodeles waltl]|uniref:Reverse transcriptase domain-containing protein n=1 Tax=Pleurodeles waltl TaxID=8319 RepID=A0AAV7QPG0_PLEWA|nr:hypothetical protein NDU88_008747 [Pleurodeles waltl]
MGREPVRLINVYAPSDEGERRKLFQRLRPQLVTSRTIMMGGDFNCILESGGRCGTRAGEGWMDDAAKLLAEMVGEASLTDVIGSMGSDARNFTWSHHDGSVRSRIDFIFTSKSVRIRQHSMVTVHFSDHRAIRFQGELTGKFLTGPGTWKLNSSLLGREDVQEELRRTYMGPDLLELYEEMEQEGVMPHTLREGMIVLLYKHKGERCDFKNWRPISFLNVDYKILAKTMVNRLKGAMGEIVHPDQTCEVPGHRVADSLALIRDTIQYITDRNIRTTLVCLDQEKAFDRVSHEFMERVLQGFGLGERFCNYVRIMYPDIFSSVMVNG